MIVTFIDPLCRNLCPLEAKVLNDVVGRMPAAQRPVILAVSVDVYADARADLLQDVRKWELVPQWRWAVGRPSQLAAVWRGYKVGVRVTTKRIAGTTINYITHTEAAYIIDRTGHERALFLWPFYPQDVEHVLKATGLTAACGACAWCGIGGGGVSCRAMIVRADRRWLIRSLVRAALVPAAALLVHQLRFLLAFGGGAGAELARQGHSYLHSLVPWIVLLLGVAVGGFLWALGRALGGQRSVPRYTLSLAALWLVCTVCLVAIYVARSFSRVCSRPAIPAGWPGSSGMAAGGRSRRRCASAWCSRRSSTAPAGCSTRSRSAAASACAARGGPACAAASSA